MGSQAARRVVPYERTAAAHVTLKNPAVLEAIVRGEGERLLSVLLGFSFRMPRLSCVCQQIWPL